MYWPGQILPLPSWFLLLFTRAFLYLCGQMQRILKAIPTIDAYYKIQKPKRQ